MSVESAWDDELHAAGEVMTDDVGRYSRRVVELEDEVAQLNDLVSSLRQRLMFHEGRAAETLQFGTPAYRRVDL